MRAAQATCVPPRCMGSDQANRQGGACGVRLDAGARECVTRSVRRFEVLSRVVVRRHRTSQRASDPHRCAPGSVVAEVVNGAVVLGVLLAVLKCLSLLAPAAASVDPPWGRARPEASSSVAHSHPFAPPQNWGDLQTGGSNGWITCCRRQRPARSPRARGMRHEPVSASSAPRRRRPRPRARSDPSWGQPWLEVSCGGPRAAARRVGDLGDAHDGR